VISYEAIIENGGAPILNYNVYIDDGNDGPFGSAIDNGLALTYDTLVGGLSLTTGNYYKFKYSGVNVQGEGPLSEEVTILMAQVPTVVTSLVRINSDTLSAGDI
jgi:hypothetical protein